MHETLFRMVHVAAMSAVVLAASAALGTACSSSPAMGSDAGDGGKPGDGGQSSDCGASCDGGDASALGVRPSYNTGKGFFVANGKLYDANGVEFRPRGVNKVHYDLASPGIPNSHANIERWVVYDFSNTAANQALMQEIIGNHIVPMPGNWTGTCDNNASTLTTIVNTWVSQASIWNAYEKYMILNIANEFGPPASSGTGWRDDYIAAVAALRNAGYLCTISITSGGCGQDNDDLLQYAQAVFDSDPQKNVIFDQHIYGNWADGDAATWQTDLTTGLDALAATGLVVIVGEFGPGRNIGPSPTNMTPNDVIQHAEARGLGWMAWAWDDTNLANWMADDNGFSLTYSPSTGFATSNAADLTIYGKAVVLDPTLGLVALAIPATIF